VFLASDRAAHWNGQCLTLNGHRTALWQSPAEQYVLESDQPFTLEALEDYLGGLEPLALYSRQSS
jgi:hypothetical protein